MFNKGDVVAAKDGYLDKGETLQDSAGIVLNYNPENDCLVIGTLHPEKYAIAPAFTMRGCFYRLITDQECLAWGIA